MNFLGVKLEVEFAGLINFSFEQKCSSYFSVLSRVEYNPTPPDLLPLAEIGDANSKAFDYYSMEYQHLHMRDLPLLRLMGCNLIRIRAWHEVPHERMSVSSNSI